MKRGASHCLTERNPSVLGSVAWWSLFAALVSAPVLPSPFLHIEELGVLGIIFGVNPGGPLCFYSCVYELQVGTQNTCCCCWCSFVWRVSWGRLAGPDCLRKALEENSHQLVALFYLFLSDPFLKMFFSSCYFFDFDFCSRNSAEILSRQ